MPKIKEEIFKAYDIRGTYPDQINKETAFCIGSGFLQFIKEKIDKKTPKIVVGRDARPSSPEIFKGLACGIKEKGGDIIDIGRASTPMLYFGVNHLKADGGIMITASHNPAGYNGMKLTRSKAIPVSAEAGMNEVKAGALERAQDKIDIRDYNPVKEDILPAFVDILSKEINLSIEGTIIVDCGNGMAGPLVRKVLDELGVEYKGLYFEPDCQFPNHEANPLKAETLGDLKKEIKEKKPVFGVAFDGDGDRVGFLDEEGRLVSGEFITGILAQKVLGKQKGATIVYDLRSSRAVPEVIRESGGVPVETRVGHSFIKALMREKKAAFAGELSSHFYFPFEFETGRSYFESSVLALVYVLKLVSESGRSLSKLVEPLRKYYQSGEINFKVENKQEVMNKLEGRYEDGAERISRLDGVKIDFEKWWFNVRPSNTEPYLRLNLEAETEELMEKKIKEVRGLIEEWGEK